MRDGINAAGVLDEIEAVSIIDESVSVIIYTSFSILLGFIHPHTILEVLVDRADSAVNDSYDNIRASGTYGPRVFYGDIGTGKS